MALPTPRKNINIIPTGVYQWMPHLTRLESGHGRRWVDDANHVQGDSRSVFAGADGSRMTVWFTAGGRGSVEGIA